MGLTMRRVTALALSLLLCLSLAAAAAEAPAAETPAAEEENFFATMQLTYLDGTPFDTSVFIGKPILINIWATWCGPCVSEMPHLNELAEEYKDRITIIGVHSEGLDWSEAGGLQVNQEKTQAALQLKEQAGLTFPLLNPDTNMFILMNDPQYGLSLQVLPTTWLVGGDGYIRAVIEGSRDKDGWVQTIDDFLNKLEEEENAKTGG